MGQVDNNFQGTEVLSRYFEEYFLLLIMNPINGALGGRGDPVDQDGGVPLHQKQREARDGVAAAFALISPSLPRQSLSNLFHLLHCCPVPAPKGFESKGDEVDALSLAVVSCSPHFPVEGKVETVSGGDSSLGHSSLLQRVDDGDVQSSIATDKCSHWSRP